MATRARIKNEDQYDALRAKGMSKQQGARIANSLTHRTMGGRKAHQVASYRRAEPPPSTKLPGATAAKPPPQKVPETPVPSHLAPHRLTHG
jgi:hypothetical protein